jgi:hypothetical protein
LQVHRIRSFGRKGRHVDNDGAQRLLITKSVTYWLVQEGGRRKIDGDIDTAESGEPLIAGVLAIDVALDEVVEDARSPYIRPLTRRTDLAAIRALRSVTVRRAADARTCREEGAPLRKSLADVGLRG